MCNAWNHPPGCTCGWGGEGHLGRSSGTGLLPVPMLRPILQSQFPTATSFTNPNANCPVCGAGVYFYQSPAGGRVFFDELGPPWPKHPCTDQSVGGVSVARKASGSLVEIPHPVEKRPRWIDEGWLPFVCEDVLPSAEGCCMLVGRLGDALTTLYLCTSWPPDNALLQVRAGPPTEFDVSMVWIDPATHSVKSAVVKAFSGAHLAAQWRVRGARKAVPGPGPEAVVKRGGRFKRWETRVGKPMSGRGNAKVAHGKPDNKGSGTKGKEGTPALRKSNRPEVRRKQTIDAKKADARPEKAEPRQPRPATGNQMWLAFVAARAEKKK